MREPTDHAEPAHQTVGRLEQRFEELETEFKRAYWDSQIEASPANDERRAQLELELRSAKGDADALEAVTTHLNEPIHDPVLKRQLEVLRLSLTDNQMDEGQRAEIVELSTSIDSDFASRRPQLDGRLVDDNEIDGILKTSDDERQREAAWRASKEIGGVASARVRELARVRNQVAHNLGFADYYRMALELQEIREEWLFDTLDELDRLTSDAFRRWKESLDSRLRERFGTNDLWPWHYADPFFQALPPDGRVSLDAHLQGMSAPDLAVRTFALWGIDISGVIEASDLYPRERKSQHAFCLDVDRSGKDIRILANVIPGERWVEVMLHESGHAAFDVSIDPGLPYLLRRATHTFVTEASALLSGRLLRDPHWLEVVVGMDRDDARKLAEPLRLASSSQNLLFARWGLVIAHFERALYSDPEADLDALWWELVERFQGLRTAPDPPAGAWAAKIHIAAAPVYYHNYLLGELLASQLRSAIEAECGGFVGSSDAGEWLIDRLYRPGALLRWDALVEEATGQPLTARSFVADLAI